MKAWMIFTTLAIVVVWVFSRRPDDGPPPPPTKKDVQVAAPRSEPNPGGDVSPESEHLSLAELLEKPRSELAALAIEKEFQIIAQDKARHDQVLVFTLMPTAQFPMAVPIWQRARYSTTRDMVLPPYLDDGAYDATLALHLARFGDVEGARKLVPPGDKATLEAVNKLALSRNFPAEWTRLVALIMHRSHYSLAEGNNDGAKRIVSLHKQLNALLDDDARNSPLGAALLSRGRMLLHQAVMVWSEGEGQDEFVEMASQSLVDWGDYVPSLPAIHTADQLANWIGGKKQGLLVSGGNPQRAVDILGLPLPQQSIQNVVGLFNGADKLEQLLYVYAPDLQEMHDRRSFVMWSNVPFLEANQPHLSCWLEEELAWQPAAEFGAEVYRTGRNSFVGTIVQIVPRTDKGESAKAPPPRPLPRDFGLVDLDRTFETNRRAIGWNQAGSHVSVTDPKILAHLKFPFPGQKIAQAALNRDSKLNLVGDFQLALAKDTKTNLNLVDVASPFWEIAGAGQVRVTGDLTANSVEFVWKDALTSLCLRLPNHPGEPIILVASDASGKDGAVRFKEAQRRDDEERSVRWAENKIATRLGRSLEQFELGMTRAELTKRIGRTKVLRNLIPSGKLVTELMTFPAPILDDADWILRQSVVRFDETGRLIEANLRFVDGPGKVEGVKKTAGNAQLVLKSLRDRSGAPEIVQNAEPSTPDLKNPFKLLRWQDDATLVTARVDEHGVEVTLKDCPREYSTGRPLAPLDWLPRGPAPHCVVGMSKASLFKEWQIKKPVMVDEAILLRPADKSPYDALLVWLDDNQRVQRVIARHRLIGESYNTPIKAGEAVTLAWGQQADVFGWPWTQKSTRQGGIVLAWSNNDISTQVRVFWQEAEGGLRLFTEWK